MAAKTQRGEPGGELHYGWTVLTAQPTDQTRVQVGKPSVGRVQR